VQVAVVLVIMVADPSLVEQQVVQAEEDQVTLLTLEMVWMEQLTQAEAEVVAQVTKVLAEMVVQV
jgi:hypothetical protein